MDLWRLELLRSHGHDRSVAAHALDALGVDTCWTGRGAGDDTLVAGLDLGHRIDPPAVAKALDDVGVAVRDLRRLPVAATPGAEHRRIA